MEKNVRMGWLLDFYGAFLTDRQRLVMDLHYNDDLSLSEIAEQEKISRQGIYDAIKRGEILLEEMEEKLGVLKHSIETNYVLNNCLKRINQIHVQSDSEEVLLELKKDIEQLLKKWEDEYGF